MKDYIINQISQHIEKTGSGSIIFQNEGFGIFDIIFKDQLNNPIVRMHRISDYMAYNMITYSICVIGFFLPKEALPFFGTAFACSLYYTIKRTKELTTELERNYNKYFNEIIIKNELNYNFTLQDNVLFYEKKQK